MSETESQNGWWNWIQNAKEKVVEQSSEVFEFVKRDIEEFSKVISQEASSVVSGTATTLKETLKLDIESSSTNQVKQSVSGFFNHVAEVFTPPPDDEGEEAIMVWNNEPMSLNRLQAARYAFCSSPSNFLKRNLDSEELYEEWLQTFDEESHSKKLTSLLSEDELLQNCYSTLVPDQMTHNDFCLRYFYEMDKLENAEKRRQEMKKRMQTIDNEPRMTWDEEEDVVKSGDISEEMQKRLLEDYEKEILEGSCAKRGTTMAFDENSLPHKENVSAEDKCGDVSNSIERNNNSKSSTPSKDTEDEWEKIDDDVSLE